MLGFGKKKSSTLNGIDNYELPSFSVSVVSLLGKLRDPDCSLSAIADELEIDPGLHVRVLKTVNSVAFGLSRKVSNVQHAVSLLGRARLESLVLSVAVKNNLDNEKMPEWFDSNLFWRAATLRAALARGLAQSLHPETQAESFTAGLLQDMAIPIITRTKSATYQQLYKDWNRSEDLSSLVQREMKSLNLNHANVGAQMARSWGFPTTLIEMISNHHTTESSPGMPLSVQIVALLKGNPDIPLKDMAPRIEELFDLGQSRFCEIALQAQDDAEELAEALR